MMWLWLVACNVSVDGKVGGPGGNAVQEVRAVEAFEQVEVASSVDVEVRIAEGPHEVIVHAPAGKTDKVRTTVSDGTLRVAAGSGVFVGHRAVTVRMPALRGVTASSLGDVEVDGLDGGPLRVVDSGSGDVELHGVVGDLEVRLSSLGNLEVDRLEGALDAEVSGSGDLHVLEGRVTGVKVRATSMGNVSVAGIEAEQVELVATGSGDITVAGTAKRLVAQAESMGDIDASGLTVEQAEVSSEGSGDLLVHATDRVGGTLSSMGDLVITGGAAHTVDATGTGDVEIR